MSKGAITFSTDVEYYTPRSIVNLFGRFDYDPATTAKKADDFGIENYDTIETDGLKSDWTKYGRIWCNPPFTKKKEFLAKAQDFYDKTGGDIYVLLPISFLTTKQFHKIVKGGIVYVPNGRIQFENERGDSKSPAFGSVVIKIQDKWELKTICLK